MSSLPSIEIQSLHRSEGQASIRIAVDGRHEGVRGRLRGPFCQLSRTLPSNHKIENGQAVIVDPCYWTPKLTFLYELRIDSEPHNFEIKWGLRWCITDRNGIRLNGKNHVVRAICPNNDFEISEIRDQSASLIVRKFSPTLCEAASEIGVMLLHLGSSSDEERQQLQLCPAVHFLASEIPLAADVLAMTNRQDVPKSVCLTGEQELVGGTNYKEQTPRFIVRPSHSGDLADLRRECDRLQRDVASFGQFAGYLVDSNA